MGMLHTHCVTYWVTLCSPELCNNQSCCTVRAAQDQDVILLAPILEAPGIVSTHVVQVVTHSPVK